MTVLIHSVHGMSMGHRSERVPCNISAWKRRRKRETSESEVLRECFILEQARLQYIEELVPTVRELVQRHGWRQCLDFEKSNVNRLKRQAPF